MGIYKTIYMYILKFRKPKLWERKTNFFRKRFSWASSSSHVALAQRTTTLQKKVRTKSSELLNTMAMMLMMIITTGFMLIHELDKLLDFCQHFLEHIFENWNFVHHHLLHHACIKYLKLKELVGYKTELCITIILRCSWILFKLSLLNSHSTCHHFYREWHQKNKVWRCTLFLLKLKNYVISNLCLSFW